VNWKSDAANGRGVSSFVVTTLGWASGASLTGVTLIVMVAATVPFAASFARKPNDDRPAPFASPAGM
jgi:hypothetical protein